MSATDIPNTRWQLSEVKSRNLDRPVPVIAAKGIAYFEGSNCLQNFNLYLPKSPKTTSMVGHPVTSLPESAVSSSAPRYLVHVHGGGWRDPKIDASSIEAAVAHAFSGGEEGAPIEAIASLNYTLSAFPTHPGDLHESNMDRQRDIAREAVHPEHVRDIILGLRLLRSLGMDDQSYILSGHSCGATIAFQAALQPPGYFGLDGISDVPCAAALVGLNGLYDLPALVDGLGPAHEHASSDFRMMLTSAFGPNASAWAQASPARFSASQISDCVRKGEAPRLVLVDQSIDDQLVPMNQRGRMEANLRDVSGLKVVIGTRCTGAHGEPWKQGTMIWESIRDTLNALHDFQ